MTPVIFRLKVRPDTSRSSTQSMMWRFLRAAASVIAAIWVFGLIASSFSMDTRI